MKILVSLLLILGTLVPLGAQDLMLQGRFWIPMDPLDLKEMEKKPTDPERIKQMWIRVQSVFSGMIYGWQFQYEPGDIRRGVEDKIELKPLGKIQWGDRDMEVLSSTEDEKNLRVWWSLRYFPKPHEVDRYKRWKFSTQTQVGGLGGGDLLEPVGADFQLSLEQALRSGVRRHLQARTHDKPRVILGEAALKDVPVMEMQAGQMVVQGVFLIKITEVRPYTFY